jgi:DDE superfamily endonuclease
MEDVLDLYAEPYDEKRPVVNFDEKSKQLVAEKRAIIAAKPGRAPRFDYEYRRNGVSNLFAFCEARAGWRHISVTERHTKQDFAAQMKWLMDAQYPQAEKIRVVLDNLKLHKPASLYERFKPEEARRIRANWSFITRPSMGVG